MPIFILLMVLGQTAILAHFLTLPSMKRINLVGITGEGNIHFLLYHSSCLPLGLPYLHFGYNSTSCSFRYMQPLISSVPIMIIEGNHDIEPQAENQTFVAYSSRFAFPSEESGSSSTLYYSFNAGGIHFIMLGSSTSYDKSG